jgi:hypothetical protein
LLGSGVAEAVSAAVQAFEVEQLPADAAAQAREQVFQLDGGAYPVQHDKQVEMDAAPRAGLQPDLGLRTGQLNLPRQRVLEVALGMKDRATCGESRKRACHIHVHLDPQAARESASADPVHESCHAPGQLGLHAHDRRPASRIPSRCHAEGALAALGSLDAPRIDTLMNLAGTAATPPDGRG